jgi:acetyl-CoA carboxylase biotin carboxyl carrier protein
MDIDLKQLKELMRALKQFDLTELEIEKNGERIKLSRSADGALLSPSMGLAPVSVSVPSLAPPAAPTLAPPGRSADEGDFHYITSPFVGTFYASPSPSAQVFVTPGSEIKPGQTLCIVEAMKLMNEIEADVAGIVVEVLRENGKPVEYGERLFKVKKH